MTDLETAVAHLADLIAVPTNDGTGNVALLAAIAARCADHGARTETDIDTDGRRGSLVATFGRRGGAMGAPDLMLVGRTDGFAQTAEAWGGDPYRLDRRDGCLFGAGAADMKGFLACLLAMLPELAPRAAMPGAPALQIVLSFDLAARGLGDQRLAGRLAGDWAGPAICVLGEPTRMQIVGGHKASLEYRMRFSTRGGHGSAPEQGSSALEVAVAFARDLMDLGETLKARAPVNSRHVPPSSTVNIGRLVAGREPTQVARDAELWWDARTVSAEDSVHIQRHVRRLIDEVHLPALHARDPEGRIELDLVNDVVGLEEVEDNAAVRLLQGETRQPVVLAPYATAAGLFQALGAETAVCGPGAIEHAHGPGEYVSEADLSACLAMLARLGCVLEASRA